MRGLVAELCVLELYMGRYVCMVHLLAVIKVVHAENITPAEMLWVRLCVQKRGLLIWLLYPPGVLSLHI